MRSLSFKSERGASLIEVLVVMVVLLVGIFTIIRIFPTGFDILQFTGNATVAHRLADAEIEYWRKNAENLPEAIVAVSPGPLGQLVLDPVGQRPNDFISGSGAVGDLSMSRQQIANQLMNYYPDVTDDLIDRYVGPNRHRRILGEVTDIPAPSPVGWGNDPSASIYSLAYGPIEWTSKKGNAIDPNTAEQYITVRGATALRTVDVTGLPQQPLFAAVSKLRPNQVAVDYDAGIIYLPRSNRPRQLIAEYTARMQDGTMKQVRGDRLTATAPGTGNRLPGLAAKLRVNVAGSSVYLRGVRDILPGSIRVTPRFRYLMPNQAFSEDPYEYKVIARYPLGVQFTGAIAFNPLGYTQDDGNPIKAAIDYTVKDWRILHQDVTLPAEAPYRTRLALPFLKEAGVTVGDNSLEPWPGLAGDPKQLISIAALDLSTGDLIVDNPSGVPGQNGRNFDVDFKTGTLRFPEQVTAFTPWGATARVEPTGRTYRIFYMVEGEWAVIPQKPHNTYQISTVDEILRSGNNSQGIIPIGTMAMDQRVLNDPDGRSYVPILFPVPDEGAAVAVDYSYRTRTGQLKTVYGQEVQISSEARQAGFDTWYYPSITGNVVTEVPKPYGKVYLPRDADINRFVNDFDLKRVQGTSFRAVAVWRDRSRWKQQAVTAYLTRKDS